MMKIARFSIFRTKVSKTRMAFSESNLNQIENFQQIHLECHCLVTSKAELIGLTKTFC